MEEPEKTDSTSPAADSAGTAEGVGDALRAAVERTLAATADSATETRQRAQNLVDDVVRRSQVAREQVAKRGEEATTRLAEAISELRTADDEDLEQLRGRVAVLERRLAAMESRLVGPEGDSNLKVEGEVSPAEPHDQRDTEV
jgi:polyhydroxyalkanoate synthesis regulator phasin